MPKDLSVIHSHSGLERELKFPKHIVLVDAVFASAFHKRGMKTTPFRYYNSDYIKVEIIDFVKVGGIFKNLDG